MSLLGTPPQEIQQLQGLAPGPPPPPPQEKDQVWVQPPHSWLRLGKPAPCSEP